jgi:hypothetical protein
VGLILLTLAVTGALARLLGGRLAAFERLPLRGWPLLAGSVAALWVGTGAALAGLPSALHWLGLAAAAGCTLAYCARNRVVHGTGLVGAGLLLNALVVMLNSGMPVSAHAAARAGVSYQEATADPRHVRTDGSGLEAFGDVIPVPLPLRPEVVSAGDLLVAAGLAQLLATAMLLGRPGNPEPDPAPTRTPPPATTPHRRHARTG